MSKSRSQGACAQIHRPCVAGVGTVGGRCLAGCVLLHDLVTTSAEVASTRSRKAKVVALAALLSRTHAEEVGLVGAAAVKGVVFRKGAADQVPGCGLEREVFR